MAAVTRILIRHPSGTGFEKLLWYVFKTYDISFSLKEFQRTVEYMTLQGVAYKGKSDRYYMAKNDLPATGNDKRRKSAVVARAALAQKRKEETNEGQNLLGRRVEDNHPAGERSIQ
jgi:hypothetical protein